MEFFNPNSHWNFLGQRRYAMILSLVLLAIAIGSLGLRGLNFGIDFTGGTLVEVGSSAAVPLPEAREALRVAGYPEAVVQHFGTTREVLVRVPPRGDVPAVQLSQEVQDALRPVATDMELRRVDFVGPQIGDELTEQGGLAMLFALGLILIYVALRFQWKFALGSVAALFHDVLITLGLFSLLQISFDLSVLAAVLAVIGYSLNDTIVVFDRIRENFLTTLKGETVDTMNQSINQTLGRTIMTSVTTLLVLFALLFVGGETIRGFSLALICGVFVGTYSSIYVASAAALGLGVRKEDLIPPEKEGAEFDEMP